MAKKKNTKAQKRKQTLAPVEKARKGRTRRPRSQILPGMEQVRSKALDNICEAIGDVRETMNAAKKEESGFVLSALQQMQRTSVTVYKHAGVELALVPGAEKLRVRLVKEEGDAGDDDLLTPAEEAEQSQALAEA